MRGGEAREGSCGRWDLCVCDVVCLGLRQRERESAQRQGAGGATDASPLRLTILPIDPPPTPPPAWAAAVVVATAAASDHLAPPPHTHTSHTQRIIGAATCLAAALLFGSLSTLFVVVSPRRFASLYTLSNLCGLAATTFLVGPAAQVKKMAAPHRAAATATYLLSLIGTLVAALKLRSLNLTLLFLIIQIVALALYTLSYIPGAQGVAWGVLTRLVGE